MADCDYTVKNPNEPRSGFFKRSGGECGCFLGIWKVMDLQKKWDGVWKMKFIQQYKNLSKEIYILFFGRVVTSMGSLICALTFDFEK